MTPKGIRTRRRRAPFRSSGRKSPTKACNGPVTKAAPSEKQTPWSRARVKQALSRRCRAPSPPACDWRPPNGEEIGRSNIDGESIRGISLVDRRFAEAPAHTLESREMLRAAPANDNCRSNHMLRNRVDGGQPGGSPPLIQRRLQRRRRFKAPLRAKRSITAPPGHEAGWRPKFSY